MTEEATQTNTEAEAVEPVTEPEQSVSPEQNTEQVNEEGVPQDYKDFDLPEGFELTGNRKDDLTSFAKENGLSQEQAQGALNLFMKYQQENAVQLQDAWTKQNEGWLQSIQDDEHLGGAKYEDSINTAIKGVDIAAKMLDQKFGDSVDLRAMLESSGMGNNPIAVKLFNVIGEMISEDSLINGAAPGQQTTREERLYK
jgi:hypothetical protein